MTEASRHLYVTLMAMTDVEHEALAAAFTRNAEGHPHGRIGAFYRALTTVIDEARLWTDLRSAEVDRHPDFL